MTLLPHRRMPGAQDLPRTQVCTEARQGLPVQRCLQAVYRHPKLLPIPCQGTGFDSEWAFALLPKCPAPHCHWTSHWGKSRCPPPSCPHGHGSHVSGLHYDSPGLPTTGFRPNSGKGKRPRCRPLFIIQNQPSAKELHNQVVGVTSRPHKVQMHL